MTSITTFIFDEKHYSGNGVKHRAFLPKQSNPKKSVFCIDALKEAEIWECGDLVERTREDGKKLKGRGDLKVEVLIGEGLAIEPDPSLHPRHCNIVGWPQDKTEMTARAQLLASKATLHISPTKDQVENQQA